jgi:hypothetical protein
VFIASAVFGHFSESQILIYQHYFHLNKPHFPVVYHLAAADAVGALAVIAVILFYRAGRLEAVTG